MAQPARCQDETRAAHRSRSSALIERTSARLGAGVAFGIAVRDERLKPFAKNVLKIVKGDGERSAVGVVHLSYRIRPSGSAVPLMHLREINLGCFGGGTGLPSLLGGLKRNPWLRLNAVVTMFDSGGSSGQLRDELGVLPPGDVLRCALALSRNEGEARRVLLARLPTLEHTRLGGHTGGNLLLSMMERYSGDFLAAVDGLRALLGCRGAVWPISVEPATLCAEYADGEVTRGEVEVDKGHARGHHVTRVWLDPPVPIHPAVRSAIEQFDAVIIGPGSFFTSLMPTLMVNGVADVLAGVKGPIIVVSNLLTEGQGMHGFTAAR